MENCIASCLGSVSLYSGPYDNVIFTIHCCQLLLFSLLSKMLSDEDEKVGGNMMTPNVELKARSFLF